MSWGYPMLGTPQILDSWWIFCIFYRLPFLSFLPSIFRIGLSRESENLFADPWVIGSHRSPAPRCHAQARHGASGAFWSWSFWSSKWGVSWETLGTSWHHAPRFFGASMVGLCLCGWYRDWSIYLRLLVTILPSFHFPSIRLSIHWPTYLPISRTCLPIYLCAPLPVYLSGCLSICMAGLSLVFQIQKSLATMVLAAAEHIHIYIWDFDKTIPKMLGL